MRRRPQASRLPGELMALLARAEQWRLRDVDVFAVATGPGSFTGLRVGIATMQGLAFAGGKPLIGVSALDALALIGAREGAGGGRARRRHASPPGSTRGAARSTRRSTKTGTQIEPPTVERPDTVLARCCEPSSVVHRRRGVDIRRPDPPLCGDRGR